MMNRAVCAGMIAMVLGWALPAWSQAPLPASQPAQTLPQLAIISDPSLEDLADLLTAALSARPDLRLLERQRIDAALKEQQLAASGLEDPQTLKLGQLLGADGLLILQRTTSAGKPVLAARLVAVHPGVVLWSMHAPFPPPAETLQQTVVGRVAALSTKLNVPPAQAIFISAVNLRSALATPRSAGLERDAKLLLIHRLVHEPSLFVLERQQMQLLTRESNLGDSATKGFQSGHYLLDGSLESDPTDSGRITLVLQLTPPDKGQSSTIKVSGRWDDLPAVSDESVRQLMAALKKQPRTDAWSREQEAQYFATEAQWSEACAQDPATVREATESALALGSREPKLRILQIVCGLNEAAGQRYGSQWNGLRGMARIISRAASLPPAEARDRLKAASESLQVLLDTFQILPTSAGDGDCRTLGIEAMTISSELIFYVHRNPSWKQCDQELADLRALLRQMDQTMRPAVEKDWRRRDYYGLKTLYAPFWFELPQEQVEAYRQALGVPQPFAIGRFEVATHLTAKRGDLPHLVAWNQADADDVGSLWERFVTDLIASNNPEQHLAGLIDQLQTTHDKGLEQKILDYLWERRELLARQELSAWFMETYFVRAAGFSNEKAVDATGRRLILDMLRRGDAHRDALSALLFNGYHLRRETTLAEAREIYSRLSAYAAGPSARGFEMYRQDMLTRFPELANGPDIRADGPEPLRVSRLVRLHGSDLRAEAASGRAWDKARWLEGRIWLMSPGYVLTVDPATGEGRSIALPLDQGLDRAKWTGNLLTFGALGVSRDYVVVTTRERTRPSEHGASVVVYDRRQQQWQVFQTFRDFHIHDRPVIIGHWMYSIFEAPSANDSQRQVINRGVVRIDLTNGQADVLVNNYRKPGISPLDDLEWCVLSIAGAADGRLCVKAGRDRAHFGLGHMWRHAERRVMAYDPRKASWEELPPMQAASVFPEVIFYRLFMPNWGTEYRLEGQAGVQFWNTSTRAEGSTSLTWLKHAGTPTGGILDLPLRFELDHTLLRRDFPEVPEQDLKVRMERDRLNVQVHPTPVGLVIPTRGEELYWWFIPQESLRAWVAATKAVPSTQPATQPSPASAVLALAVDTGHLRQIHLATESGQVLPPLVPGWFESERPCWSPDGRRLAFVCWRDDNADIFLANADGSGLRNLTDSWAEEFDPAWSPDGSHIVCVSRRDGQTDLSLIDIETGRQQKLTDDPAIESRPQWSHDGHSLIFTSRQGEECHLVVLDLATRQPRTLLSVAGQLASATFSRDDRRILFTTTAPGRKEHWLYQMDLTDADGANRHLIYDKADVTFAAFVPDGRILFGARQRDEKQTPTLGALYLLDLTTGQTRQLLTRLADTPAVWRPSQAPSQ